MRTQHITMISPPHQLVHRMFHSHQTCSPRYRLFQGSTYASAVLIVCVDPSHLLHDHHNYTHQLNTEGHHIELPVAKKCTIIKAHATCWQ